METPDPSGIAFAAIMTCAAAFAYFYGRLFFGKASGDRRFGGLLVLVVSLALAWWLMGRGGPP